MIPIVYSELAFATRDTYPVTPTLIVPRGHAETYFDLHDPERRAINVLLDQVRRDIAASVRPTAGAGMRVPIHPHMLRHVCGYALANEATTAVRCRRGLGISSTRCATWN
jgi:hypothetical protein